MDKSFSLFPKQASNLAVQVDLLYFFMLAVTAFFTLLIAGLVIFFAIKYRRRPGLPPPEKFENARLEMLWTVIPLLICVVMFVWGAKVVIAQSKIPDNCLEVNVIGKQWMWHTQHQEGRREINQLTVPVGRPVKLTMTSQDVIHSFYMPAFRIKQDVLPGRYSYLWFEPTEPGEYHLFCAEYCGTEHSGMIGKVVVLSEPDYQRWLQNGPKGEVSPEEAGAKIFVKNGCMGCHSQMAPSMAGLYGRKDRPVMIDGKLDKVSVVDDGYLRESILYPRAKIAVDADGKPYKAELMPSFGTMLSEEEISQLLAFIKTQGINSNLGNRMNLGSKMMEQNPTPPDMSTRNSDPSKRSN